MTHLVYIHEAADQATSALGVLLVPVPVARRSLEQLRAWRRDLNARYGLAVHAPHRISELLTGAGPWRRRAPDEQAGREAVVAETLHQLAALGSLGVRAFAVAIPDLKDARFHGPPARAANRAVFQRLQVFADRYHTEVYLHVQVQQPPLFQREARAATRALTAPSSVDPETYHRLPFTSLLEHPRFYPLQDSYRMQAAAHLSWAALEAVRRPAARTWWAIVTGSPLALEEANRHERRDLGSDELPALIVLPDRVLPAG